MPATTAKQQRFMGADYGRAKAGQPTKTGMGMSKLRDFARKPAGGFKGRQSPRAMAIQNRMKSLGS